MTFPTFSPALAANESLSTAVMTTPLTSSEILYFVLVFWLSPKSLSPMSSISISSLIISLFSSSFSLAAALNFSNSPSLTVNDLSFLSLQTFTLALLSTADSATVL